jgi:hypothetical protein
MTDTGEEMRAYHSRVVYWTSWQSKLQAIFCLKLILPEPALICSLAHDIVSHLAVVARIQADVVSGGLTLTSDICRYTVARWLRRSSPFDAINIGANFWDRSPAPEFERLSVYSDRG